MSKKHSEKKKEPEITPEFKDTVFSFSELMGNEVAGNEFKDYPEKTGPKLKKKFFKPDLKIGNAAMDLANSKTPLPPNASLHIIFNSSQEYKGDEYGTYKELELTALVKAATNRLRNLINVIPTIDIESNTNMFQEYGIMISDNIEKNRRKFCGNINKIFIDDSLAKCNALLILYDGRDEIIGFATLFFLLDSNEVYIDVICSHQKYKGGGHAMLTKIKELSLLLGMRSIELSSVTEALGFYIGKEDFECKDLCPLTYNIHKKTSYKKKKGKSKKTKRKSGSRSKK
jgi:hypothetical protein